MTEYNQNTSTWGYLTDPFVVEARLGLHARPSMTLFDHLSGCTGEVKVLRLEENGDAHRVTAEADGKSIMNLMLLGAGQGTKLGFGFENREDYTPDLDQRIRKALRDE